MLLIGSQAAIRCYNLHLGREPEDIDLIATYEEFEKFSQDYGLTATPLSKNKFLTMWNGTHTEIEIAWPGSTGASLLEMLDGYDNIFARRFIFQGLEVTVPCPDWLYALKSSHKYLKDNPHFLKTMSDYRYFRDTIGCAIPNEKWFKAREKETYNRPRPRLNRNKSEFFAGDGIDYVYDHDSIHESMKHLNKPAYLYYAKDGHEVLSDRKKWELCSEEIKLFGVLEETYVLALERSQIPYPTTPPLESFTIALEKVCTSITSGWFRAYAYENYHRALAAYNPLYVEKFRTAQRKGIIKPFAVQ